MYQYVLRRLWQVVPTGFLATIVVFLIITLSPGDPIVLKLGTEATAADIAAERAALGLDQPLPVRYVKWLRGVMTLDLGRSIINRQEVWSLLMQRLPATLELSLVAMALSIGIGFSLGIVAALRQNSAIDSAITAFNAIAISVPSFWLGLLLILVFAVNLGWLPPSGRGDILRDPLGELRYLILPAICLAIQGCAVYARYVRSSLLDVLAADYVRTARAKGLEGRVVILRHALRNALLPPITVMAMSFGHILGGAVVTESVFSWPGMGRLIVYSILNKDYAVVQGVLLITVFFFLFVALCVDVVYGWLDPRIKLERAK